MVRASSRASRTQYPSAAAFADDLRLVHESLARNRGERLATLLLDLLLRQVETFGFHLHTLDIRQHTRVHASAAEELFDGTTAVLPAPPSEDTTRVLETLRTVATLKQEYAPECIRSYVISGARSVDDVLTAVRLAELAGVRVGAEGADPGLMPVPRLRVHRRPRRCPDDAARLGARRLSAPASRLLGGAARR